MEYSSSAVSIDEPTEEENSLSSDPIDLSKYELKCEIGRDRFSKFYEITDKETNQKYVAKILQNSSGNLNRIKIFFKEVEILSKFNSPFILKYIGYNLTDLKGKSSPTIINEFAQNDTLTKLIEKETLNLAPSEWNDTKKLIVIYGIASGMAHIHSKGVNHHSLSSGNIFLDDYLIPKISGFELATFEKNETVLVKNGDSKKELYLAPEIIKNEKYTKASDVYSFSLIVYEIITGKKPYGKPPNYFQFLSDIANGKRFEIDEKVPLSYANLMRKCWSQDPKERPTFDEIVTLLKSDKSFITDSVNEKEFIEFIESIECQQTDHVFSFNKVHIKYPKNKELLIDLDPIDLSLYEKGEYINEGQFGKVFKAKEKSTGKICVAKTNIKLISNCNESQYVSLVREITILSKLDSPAVMKFIGYSPLSFSKMKKPTIITEFYENSSLDKIIKLQNCESNTKGWTDTNILITMYGIASGMSYIHSKNILHRDLKPGNIFLDKYLFPKIGDFGLAIDISKEEIDPSVMAGTWAYIAPEIFESNDYSKAGDVYAFSIIVYEMIAHENPISKFNRIEIMDKILEGYRPSFDAKFSESYKKLIESCWNQDPNKRPTFTEIVNMIEKDEGFITEKVNKDEFFNYIKYLNDNKINESFLETTIDFEELKKVQESDPTLTVSFLDLNKFTNVGLIKKVKNFYIYELREKETDNVFDGKISKKRITNLSLHEIIHLSREINIISQLNHPSFLKFIGYSPIDFNKQPNPVIVTEMPANRSLARFLRTKKKQILKNAIEFWNDTKKLIIIYGIASGMAYLHLHDIIHRDLCPENIYLNESVLPKIGGFGLLKKIRTNEKIYIPTSNEIKGNIKYASPELLTDYKYSESSDVYAFSLVCYEILTLAVPFKNLTTKESIIEEVVNKKNRPTFDADVDVPICYKNLIERCWSQNPDDRPTFREILLTLRNDPQFITEGINKDDFIKYVDYIRNSKIEFYSKNRVVKFDEIIIKKSKSKDDWI